MLGENDINSLSKVKLLRKVSLGIRAVVFTCSIDAMENFIPAGSGQGICGGGNFDQVTDFKYLSDSIGACIYHLKLKDVLEKCLTNSMSGNDSTGLFQSFVGEDEDLSVPV